MTNQIRKAQITPGNEMKNFLANKGIQDLFRNAMEKNADSFMTSIIDVYSNDEYLAKSDPRDVAMEALKAATLKLPINKNLGFAYIIAYYNNKSKKFEPQMQIGYKGYIQLAMRSGLYKNLNANVIYEGMEVIEDYISGQISIKGNPTSDKVIGYFAYFALLNGFEKIKYMTREEIENHATKFSKTYPNGAWKENFDAMAMKTVTRLLISKYGPMSTELEDASKDDEDIYVETTVKNNAHVVELDSGIIADTETGEVIEVVEAEEIEAPF